MDAYATGVGQYPMDRDDEDPDAWDSASDHELDVTDARREARRTSDAEGEDVDDDIALLKESSAAR